MADEVRYGDAVVVQVEGNYVTLRQDGSDALEAIGTDAAGAEVFLVVPPGPDPGKVGTPVSSQGLVSLQATNRRYVSVDEAARNELRACMSEVTEWETLTISTHDGAPFVSYDCAVFLQDWHGAYVVCVQDPPGRLIGGVARETTHAGATRFVRAAPEQHAQQPAAGHQPAVADAATRATELLSVVSELLGHVGDLRDDLQHEVSSLHEQQACLRQEIGRLEEELSSAIESVGALLETRERQRNRLRLRVEEQEAEAERLARASAEVAELEQRSHELQDHADRLRALAGRLPDVRAKVTELEALVGADGIEVESLERRALALISAWVDRCAAWHQQLRQDVQAAISSACDAEERLAVLQEQARNAVARHASLEDEVAKDKAVLELHLEADRLVGVALPGAHGVEDLVSRAQQLLGEIDTALGNIIAANEETKRLSLHYL